MRSSGYDYDVVVIGGGPAGAVAAAMAAQRGAKVLLVEKGDPAAKPVRCTGLVSLRTLKEAAISPAEVVIRSISGVSVYAPNGSRLHISGGEARAVVIDRRRFDLLLLERAATVGVEVRTGTVAVDLKDDLIRLREGGREWSVRAGLVIGADGPQSRVARWRGLPSPERLIFAVQVLAPYHPEWADSVEVFLGRRVAPNFFAWAVPAEEGRARVGLGLEGESEGNTRAYLERLLERLGLDIAEAGEPIAGLIPIGPPARTVADRTILVGDAAGQAKPTSGGGLYTGIVCAKLAGEVAAKCIESGDTSAAALAEYEWHWRKALGRELTFGMIAHRLLTRLSDSTLDRIIASLNDPWILALIVEHGDIDYPSRLALAFLRAPGLWGKFARLVPKLGLLRDFLVEGGLEEGPRSGNNEMRR
ncbi:MAG: geranylgeranyl reductase family protein [Candidatus Bipolaricaulia bacterium]